MTIKKTTSRELPMDVKMPFIQSLYEKRSVIVLGMITQVVFSCAAAWRRASNIFYYFALDFGVLALLRLGDMLLYDKAVASGAFVKHVEIWELRYTVGGTIAAIVTGFFYFTAISSGSKFAEELGWLWRLERWFRLSAAISRPAPGGI